MTAQVPKMIGGETDGTTGDGLTPAAMLSRIQALQPLIEAGSVRAQRERSLTPEVVAALRQAGVFRMMVPKSVGGLDMGVQATLNVIAEVGRADPAAAWVTTIFATGLFLTRTFNKQLSKLVYAAGPDPLICFGNTPNKAILKEGGIEAHGKWSFVSGCDHAEWAFLAVAMSDSEGDVVGMGGVLVPRSDFVIEDTWQMSGMEGTGSQTIVLSNLFVPASRMVTIGTSEGSVDMATVMTVFSCGLVGPVLGGARGVHGLVAKQLAKGKTIAYTNYERAVDSPGTQAWFAAATESLDTAEMYMARATEAADAAVGGRPLTLLDRTRIRRDSVLAMDHARRAVDKLLDIAGAGSFAQANPIQKLWRDINVGSRHAQMSGPIASEDYAKALLGFLSPSSVIV